MQTHEFDDFLIQFLMLVQVAKNQEQQTWTFLCCHFEVLVLVEKFTHLECVDASAQC